MTNPHAIALADQLASAGVLQSPRWGDAFAEVPRHVFLRRFLRLTPNGAYEAIDESHPDWMALVYDDQPLTTQLDGDDSSWDRANRDGPIYGTPTSASTSPTLMAAMLEALNVDDGQRVLEIGTGTGYNAAILAHRIGEDAVTTVDVDARLIHDARNALIDAGYCPTIAVADGTTGYPDNAPYDRVIATCSVSDIPREWITQTRPGGVILAYLYRGLGEHIPVRLTVSDDRSASGWVLRQQGSFMPARSHATVDPAARLTEVLKEGTGGYTRTTHVRLGTASTYLAALFMPDVARIDYTPIGGEPQMWLFHPNGSWACMDPFTMRVEQGGPTHLWSKIEQAADRWTDLGKPQRDRFGLTVEPDGTHRLWMDHERTGSWKLPSIPLAAP